MYYGVRPKKLCPTLVEITRENKVSQPVYELLYEYDNRPCFIEIYSVNPKMPPVCRGHADFWLPEEPEEIEWEIFDLETKNVVYPDPEDVGDIEQFVAIFLDKEREI